MDYLNNRYHDPTLGRFISVDPLIDRTRDAYGYASNNPITFADPTGLEAGSWYDDSNMYAASEKARPLASAAELTAAYDSAVAACSGGCSNNEADANLRIMEGRRPDGVPRTDGMYLVAALATVLTGGAAAELLGGSALFAGCIKLCTPAGVAIAGLADPNPNPANVAAAASGAADEALGYATRAEKLDHIFVDKHNLWSLVQKFGSREAVVKQMLSSVEGLTPASGTFEETVIIGGQTVVVRGAVVNGVTKLGTAFTP